MIKRLLLGFGALVATSGPSMAHINPLEHGSFAAGFMHPLSGLDHVLAMVTVGAWAALIGGRGIWQLPATFIAMMGAGFLTAIAGLPVPFVEPAILASLIVLGLLVMMAAPVPEIAVFATVGFFAFFHGHAHGSELGGANALPYAAAFALAAVLLHMAGIAVTLAAGRLLSAQASRFAGRAVGAASVAGGLVLALS